jgi:hypothetical protein
MDFQTYSGEIFCHNKIILAYSAMSSKASLGAFQEDFLDLIHLVFKLINAFSGIADENKFNVIELSINSIKAFIYLIKSFIKRIYKVISTDYSVEVSLADEL